MVPFAVKKMSISCIFLENSLKIEDHGKKFDTMANVSNLAGNPLCVVIDNTLQVQLPRRIDTLAIVSNFLP